MYSLFCESLNKIQMKLMQLMSHTDFTIKCFGFFFFYFRQNASTHYYLMVFIMYSQKYMQRHYLADRCAVLGHGL